MVISSSLSSNPLQRAVPVQQQYSTPSNSDKTENAGARRIFANVSEKLVEAARSILDRLVATSRSVVNIIKNTWNSVVKQCVFPSTADDSEVFAFFGPRSTHGLKAIEDISNRLLSSARSDSSATGGLFRVPGDAASVKAAHQAIAYGKTLDCSSLDRNTSASLLKQMVGELLNVRACDIQHAAKETLNLPADSSITEISRVVTSLDAKARIPFEAAFVAKIEANLEKSLFGNQKNIDTAKRAVSALGTLFNSAPDARDSTFSKDSMATSFNLLKDAGTTDIAETISAFKLAPRMIWDAIGSQTPLEVTHF